MRTHPRPPWHAYRGTTTASSEVRRLAHLAVRHQRRVVERALQAPPLVRGSRLSGGGAIAMQAVLLPMPHKSPRLPTPNADSLEVAQLSDLTHEFHRLTLKSLFCARLT